RRCEFAPGIAGYRAYSGSRDRKRARGSKHLQPSRREHAERGSGTIQFAKLRTTAAKRLRAPWRAASGKRAGCGARPCDGRRGGGGSCTAAERLAAIARFGGRIWLSVAFEVVRFW